MQYMSDFDHPLVPAHTSVRRQMLYRLAAVP